MKNKMLGSLLLLFLLSASSFALDSDRFVRGFSYGRFLNAKVIDPAPAENGNALMVSYGYNFTDWYTLDLELTYCLDDNVLNASIPASTQVQTCTILNINNIYKLSTFGKIRPYFSFGTALYAANVLIKNTDTFSLYRSYIFADFNAGIGGLFKFNERIDLYADLVFHSIDHGAYHNRKFPLMLSFGFKELF
jgi:hypothetical protein